MFYWCWVPRNLGFLCSLLKQQNGLSPSSMHEEGPALKPLKDNQSPLLLRWAQFENWTDFVKKFHVFEWVDHTPCLFIFPDFFCELVSVSSDNSCLYLLSICPHKFLKLVYFERFAHCLSPWASGLFSNIHSSPALGFQISLNILFKQSLVFYIRFTSYS